MTVILAHKEPLVSAVATSYLFASKLSGSISLEMATHETGDASCILDSMHLCEAWQNCADKHCFVGPPDFIHKLFELRKSGKVTDVDIMNTINSNIAAGSDTTGATLSAAFYHTIRTPHVLMNLREEIGRLSTEGKCSDPTTFAEAQQMPYLQALIKETLRIHPATGLLHGRVVPAEVSSHGAQPHDSQDKFCLCIYPKQYDVLP